MIPSGTKIICPNCKKELGELAVDLKFGMQLTSSVFKFKNTKMVQFGAPMNCDSCGHGYFNSYTGQIHTHNGWQSDSGPVFSHGFDSENQRHES